MSGDPVANLENLLAKGQDSAVLRFSLGNALARQSRYDEAATQFRRALEFDPQYSAAWKGLARSLADAGRTAAAADAYAKGIAAAEGRGDVQAGKEMTVFLKRLLRKQDSH